MAAVDRPKPCGRRDPRDGRTCELAPGHVGANGLREGELGFMVRGVV